MKRFILPLVALTLLVDAHSSTPKSAQGLSPESIGTRRTVWGVLPTYDVPGQRFTFARVPPATVNLSGLKSVTLDVLINADGAVKEAAVASSSGDPATDTAALATFKNARYSLAPGDDYPSPFVVQHKITFVPHLPPGTTYLSANRSPTKPNRKPSGPPVNTGTRSTAWGELPTYDGTGQSFAYARDLRFPFVPSRPTSVSVTLDVMVNADGSVKDATVTGGSSDPAFNYTILASYIGARYSLQLGPDYPAPYVVQTKIEFHVPPAFSDTFGPGRFDSMPPPGAPYYQAWSGAGGGWSGGGSYSNSSSSGSSSSSSSSSK